MSFVFENNQLEAFAPENRVNFTMALLYSALLVSIVAHGSYYWLLKRLPIYVVSTSGLMTTVIAILSSALILGEALTGELLLGGLVTLLGIGLILFRNTQKLSNATPPTP